ncbi:hypothetical protein FN846DRAFT_890941 [Sphaerosporella brunnea]|uniref:Uncharacterized protein n=1 Tax=Sphaerosporella brunnea TaxID=1250544 RepID=A0A5J5EV16_9PEZI|nr:hypothetical protein FN846DRAFT_890941 [Sphaerosporella brunnea]
MSDPIFTASDAGRVGRCGPAGRAECCVVSLGEFTSPKVSASGRWFLHPRFGKAYLSTNSCNFVFGTGSRPARGRTPTPFPGLGLGNELANAPALVTHTKDPKVETFQLSGCIAPGCCRPQQADGATQHEGTTATMESQDIMEVLVFECDDDDPAQRARTDTAYWPRTSWESRRIATTWSRTSKTAQPPTERSSRLSATRRNSQPAALTAA